MLGGRRRANGWVGCRSQSHHCDSGQKQQNRGSARCPREGQRLEKPHGKEYHKKAIDQEASRHDVAMRSQGQSTGPVGIGQAERFPSQAPHEVILDKCQDYQDTTKQYRSNRSGKSGCFSHAIIESAFIARIYLSPPRHDALKISWLLLIRTMESTLGMQKLRSDPVDHLYTILEGVLHLQSVLRANANTCIWVSAALQKLKRVAAVGSPQAAVKVATASEVRKVRNETNAIDLAVV